MQPPKNGGDLTPFQLFPLTTYFCTTGALRAPRYTDAPVSASRQNTVSVSLALPIV